MTGRHVARRTALFDRLPDGVETALVGPSETLRYRTGLSLAFAVYATPYATRSILTTMYNFDRSIEEAAMNLGADERQTFLRITFPALLPGLLTAAIFSFVVCYSNLQIAVFLQGRGLTPIPVRIFAQMQFGASPVIAAVATIDIFIVLFAIVLVERLFGAAEALGYS